MTRVVFPLICTILLAIISSQICASKSPELLSLECGESGNNDYGFLSLSPVTSCEDFQDSPVSPNKIRSHQLIIRKPEVVSTRSRRCSTVTPVNFAPGSDPLHQLENGLVNEQLIVHENCSTKSPSSPRQGNLLAVVRRYCCCFCFLPESSLNYISCLLLAFYCILNSILLRLFEYFKGAPNDKPR